MSSMPAIVSGPDCTLIVPVYRNEENIPQLLERFAQLNSLVSGGIEVICVVDGSLIDHASCLRRACQTRDTPPACCCCRAISARLPPFAKA